MPESLSGDDADADIVALLAFATAEDNGYALARFSAHCASTPGDNEAALAGLMNWPTKAACPTLCKIWPPYRPPSYC